MTTHLDAVLARMTTFIRSLPDHELAPDRAWEHALDKGWISRAVFKSYGLKAEMRDGELHLELVTKFQTVVFEEAIEIEGEATPEPWDSHEHRIEYDHANGANGFWVAKMACGADAEFVDHARMYYVRMARMLKRILAEECSPEIVEIMRTEFDRITDS